jgi:hypothetical protein
MKTTRDDAISCFVRGSERRRQCWGLRDIGALCRSRTGLDQHLDLALRFAQSLEDSRQLLEADDV